MMTAASTPSATVTIGQRRRAERRCFCARWPFRVCGWPSADGQPSGPAAWSGSVTGQLPVAILGSSTITAGCGAV